MKIKRFTLKRKDGSYTFKTSSALPFAIAKLGRFEDAEEQGLLKILPCKLGDTVHIIGHKYRHGSEEYWINTGKFTYSDLERLGKTVFITRSEAEEALARMKGE